MARYPPRKGPLSLRPWALVTNAKGDQRNARFAIDETPEFALVDLFSDDPALKNSSRQAHVPIL
ncbi:hypothetical protein [Streptomyces sp. NPDC002403]